MQKTQAPPRRQNWNESKSRKKLNHATRASLCEQYGVKNTGRQWKKLRSQLRRIAKAVQVVVD